MACFSAVFTPAFTVLELSGRDFNVADQADGPPAAIVNQTLARQLWPNESATGRSLLFGCDHARILKVVGVARDSRIRSLNEPALPHVYLPFSQAYEGGVVFIVIETAGDRGSLTESIRKMLVSSHPDFRTYGVKRLSESLGFLREAVTYRDLFHRPAAGRSWILASIPA